MNTGSHPSEATLGLIRSFVSLDKCIERICMAAPADEECAPTDSPADAGKLLPPVMCFVLCCV